MSRRVILFGCQAISIDILKFLFAQTDVEVLKVITYEVSSDISRGQESIKTVASELGIDVSSPSRVSDKLVEEIKNLQPDLIISAYYRKIFPEKLIDIPRLGIVNIHPSLLPSFKGAHAVKQSLDAGVKISGCTVHWVDKGMDTGKIISQLSCCVLDNDSEESLSEKIHLLEHKIYPETIKELIKDITYVN